MIIYYIKNKLNGKMYIGQTIHTLKYRMYRHVQKVKQNNPCKLYQAIRKYGWENFEINVLCECSSKDELDEKETYYINYYDTYKNGYNMTLGGDSNLMFVEEYRKKHDDKMKTIEVRNKISLSMQKLKQTKGFSKETKQKISEKLKGNTNYLHSKFPRLTSVRCFNKDRSFQKEFKTRTDASNWWKQNGNPKGITKRMRDINNCIIQKTEINGLFWEIIDK